MVVWPLNPLLPLHPGDQRPGLLPWAVEVLLDVAVAGLGGSSTAGPRWSLLGGPRTALGKLIVVTALHPTSSAGLQRRLLLLAACRPLEASGGNRLVILGKNRQQLYWMSSISDIKNNPSGRGKEATPPTDADMNTYLHHIYID